MLRDIADFFDSFMQLASDPEKLKPAIIVAAGVGIAAFLVTRAIYRKPEPKPTGIPIPLPSNCEQELAAARSELERVQAELESIRPRLSKYQSLVTSLQGEEDELWRLRGSGRAPEVARLERFPGRIITFANLKGGVGKTTLVANMARYFDAMGKRVLVIDLDYQGSLSDMLYRASGYSEAPRSKADAIFDGGMTPRDLLNQAVPLRAQSSRQILLQRTHLLPSGFSLNRAENRAMLSWLVGEATLDARYSLLRLLTDDSVVREFDIVLLDTPPRWSTGTINALASSTHLVVPTILDNLAAANVGTFLQSASKLMRLDLNPSLRLAGVVGTMTNETDLDRTESDVYANLTQQVKAVWGDGDGVFKTTIPQKSAISHAAGRTLVDLELFQAFGDELCRRIDLK